MSSGAPLKSRSPEGATLSNSSNPSKSLSDADRLVLEYVRSRNFRSAEQALLQDIEDSPDDEKKKGKEHVVSSEEFVKQLSTLTEKKNEEPLKDHSTLLQNLTSIGNQTNAQNLIATVGISGTQEILSPDPTDKLEGFRELESWVDGSLDMYRVRSPHKVGIDNSGRAL
jgi:transcription initiation factor TFIID subunit 5